MGVTLNIIAITLILYMSYIKYRDYSKSMKICGEVLETIRVGGKTFIIAGVILVVIYPFMAFSQGLVYDQTTLTSILVLIVVLFSFIVTYRTAALYFTQNGLVMKGQLVEYSRVKKYNIVDDGKKTAISVTVKTPKDKELHYYFKLSKVEKMNVEKIMSANFSKTKKNKNRTKKKSK